MKEKIEKWYRQGLWNADMVQQAADRGVLTETEARGILEEQEDE